MDCQVDKKSLFRHLLLFAFKRGQKASKAASTSFNPLGEVWGIRRMLREVLQHPPYSPDLNTTDFHLYRCLSNERRGPSFENQDHLGNWLNNFFNTGTKDFCQNEINKLVKRRGEVVNNEGQYITD